MGVDAVTDAAERPNPADHLGLVRMCVYRSRRFRSHAKRHAAMRVTRGVSLPVEDSEEYAEGCVALAHAAIHFDPTRGVKFNTYAVNCIKHAIDAMDRFELQGKRDARREMLESSLDQDEHGATALDYIPSREGDPSATDDAEHNRKLARRLLNRLTPRNRKCVEMYVMHGRSLIEVGAAIDPPVNNRCASFLARRALQVMREFAHRRGIEW